MLFNQLVGIFSKMTNMNLRARSELIASIARFKTLDEVLKLARLLFSHCRPGVIKNLVDTVERQKDSLKVFSAHRFLLKNLMEDDRPIDVLRALIMDAPIRSDQPGKVFSFIDGHHRVAS